MQDEPTELSRPGDLAPALFHWRWLRIRWNPPEGVAAIQQSPEAGETTLGGTLTLRGFDRTSGIIDRCDFQIDESLPRGTMIIEPN